ncbi:MAG: hypothetical protein J6Y19_07580 [Kiritimatiellae bacterium]|nr:hypothetical protein [Kiritimatiellia bacterium]
MDGMQCAHDVINVVFQFSGILHGNSLGGKETTGTTGKNNMCLGAAQTARRKRKLFLSVVMVVSLSIIDKETTGTTGENNMVLGAAQLARRKKEVVFIRCHGCFPFNNRQGNNGNNW